MDQKANGQQSPLGTKHDNRQIDNGVTYDAITAERLLGVTTGQLTTLVSKGVLVPCNQPAPGVKRYYRRFTPAAIEAAKPRMAEVLMPQKARAMRPSGDVVERLDRIEAMLQKLVDVWVK